MAFLDRILPRSGTETLPTEQTLGHTPPAPDPGQVPPRIGPPLGASGRANFYGLPTPDERNPLLVGTRGLELLDEMYRTDAHVRRLVLAAWSPITAGTWSIEPYGGDDASDQDREIADQVWWALTEHMSPNLYEHLASLGPLLLRSGFVPFEQVWAPAQAPKGGKTLMLPRKLDVRLPRSVWRFWQDDYGELSHIGQILPNKPDVVIPASELVYYRLAPEGDNWQGTSLLRHAYKHWYMKDRLERIAAIGEERKAVGVPVVYPPQNADEQTKREVEQVLAGMHVSEVAYLLMPGPHAQHAQAGEGWEVDVIKFDSSSGSSINSVLEYHQQAIAASFLTDFLELGHHQVGARATAQVQEDPFLTAVEAIAVPFVMPALNRLVQRIVELNWESAAGAPRLKLALHDQASLSEIAVQYVVPLITAGAMQADPELEDWLRERGDLPPANAELRDLKQQQAAAAAQAQIEAIKNPPPPDQQPPAKPGQDRPAPAKPGQPEPAKPNGPPQHPGKQLAQPEPSAKWWERLLSQDRLREAMDGARDHVQQAAHAPALDAARKLANQAANGQPLPDAPPPELVDALSRHYEDLYALGHDTVRTELASQRQALGTQLDARDVFAAAGARLSRARQRGEHSARNIVDAIGSRLRRDQVTGLKDAPALQRGAEQAATGQLRVEALANAAAQIGDGRHDAAITDGGVIGGYYTSCLDGATCDPCASSDDDELMSLDDAALATPNPACEGGDYCRCLVVWVLSDDPAALGAVTGG